MSELLARLKKYYQWYLVLRREFDWDHAYIILILRYKLLRTYRALRDGVAEQEPEHMIALRDAFKLCGKLYRDNYDTIHLDPLDIDYNIKDLNRAYETAHKERLADRALLFELLYTYMDNWWD